MARHRPLVVGCSIGTRAGLVGSLGVFATRGEKPGFITSPSAIAPFGSEAIGESVFQPGASGRVSLSERTRVGTVAAIAAELSGTGPTRFGAFVELFGEVPIDPTFPVMIGSWRAFGDVLPPDKIVVGATVAKLGCATGMSFGEGVGIDMTMPIQVSDRRKVPFGGLIEIAGRFEPFSLPGDAGAAVFDPVSGAVLALVVAGSDGTTDQRSYAMPPEPTLRRLDAHLIAS
jgi:hypothetical protein